MEASESAVQMHGIEAEIFDLNTGEIPRSSYDVICSSHAIEHLSNPRHFLSQSAAGLVSSGLLYLGLPVYTRARIGFHQVLYKMGVANFPYNLNLPDHISYFGPKLFGGH